MTQHAAPGRALKQRHSALSESAEEVSFFSELVQVAPMWMFRGRSVGAALFKGASAVYKPEVEEETVVELGGTAWERSATNRRQDDVGTGVGTGGVVVAEAVRAAPL